MHTVDFELVKIKLKSLEINCIKEKITERGVTQKWVAQRLNKTTNTLNGWCCNKVQPHLIDLFMLSILLSCTVEELIGEVDRETILKDCKDC